MPHNGPYGDDAWFIDTGYIDPVDRDREVPYDEGPRPTREEVEPTPDRKGSPERLERLIGKVNDGEEPKLW
jgi:hypothetical protein